MAKHLGVYSEKSDLFGNRPYQIAMGTELCSVVTKVFRQSLQPELHYTTDRIRGFRSPVFSQTIINSIVFKCASLAFLFFPSKCVSKRRHICFTENNVSENMKLNNYDDKQLFSYRHADLRLHRKCTKQEERWVRHKWLQ